MFIRISLFSVILTLVLAGMSHAQAYRFLNVPFHARSAALGGAPVALPDPGVGMMHANPAYLNADHHRQASFSVARQIEDTRFASAHAAWHIDGWGTVGAAVRHVSYGALRRRDADGVDLGGFNASDQAVKAVFSARVGSALRYGIAVDLLHSDYTHVRSSAWAASAGLVAHLPDASVLGLSVLNAGSQIRTFDGVKEALPLDVRLGYSRRLQYLPFRFSITAQRLHEPDLRRPMNHVQAGGEFLFGSDVRVRFGYDHRLREELRFEDRIDLAGYSMGVGFRIKGVRMDLSRVSYSQIGTMLHIGTDIPF
jgi:hypothetical protein